MAAEAQNADPAPQTKAFQDLMAEAAASGSYEKMLAVLVVAEWVYLSWAAPVSPPRADLPFWFAEWITLHAGEGFEGVVAYLRGQLDTQWETLDSTAREEAEALFLRAVKLERAFWDAAWAAD
jgi:thiaminase/transcriptional activator TenA